MKKWKKGLCLTMAGLLTIGMCACGGEKTGSEGKNKGEVNKVDSSLAKECVYRAEEIALDIDLQRVSLSDTILKDNRIYMLLEDWENLLDPNKADGAEADEAVSDVIEKRAVSDAAVKIDVVTEEVMPSPEIGMEENYGPGYYVLSINADGTDKQLNKLNTEVLDNRWIGNLRLMDDGTVVGFQENYEEDLSDPENPVFSLKFKLLRWDGQGNLVLNTDISCGENEYIYPNNILLQNENVVIITDNSMIFTFDADGKEVSRNELQGVDAYGLSQMIHKSGDNYLVITHNNEYTKTYVSDFNLATGTMGEKKELPGSLGTFYGFMPGYNTDFAFCSSTALFTYSIGDAEPVKLMDFINSDMSTYNLNNISFISEKEFIATYYDPTDEVTRLAKFTYVNPADIPDKETLLLGCNYLDEEIKKRVVNFNKTNDRYRIAIKDYSVYNTLEDYELGDTQINNDIISGKMPDIMILNSNQDISNWVNKGLLTDIGELLAKDEELSKKEYLENVWKAFAVNGKYYTLIPSFTVRTTIARKDLVGYQKGWTMTEFKAFMNTLPKDTEVYAEEMIRSEMLDQVMQLCGSDFVDINTGKCNFDTPEFIELLEFIKNLKKDYDENYWENYDWQQIEGKYRNKKAVLMDMYMDDFRYMIYNIHGRLGDEAVFVGFPGISGNSSVIMPSTMYAISAKSACQEGAWEFVKQFISEDYQKNEYYYGFPVLKSVFEEKAQDATKKQTYTDVDGTEVEIDDTYWFNGEEIVVEPFSQQEITDICNFIYGIEKRGYYNKDIINIVKEEAESFFEGQKSAKEVVQIIQSRVQLYVDENS